ncbi:MAG: YkgJ family cysteine cluster protein [Proteobacteria bacterium]|nr:YkgJ family cysteine cluster protein [Pseudomonadota bacterium]
MTSLDPFPILERLYDLHDRAVAEFPRACGAGCAACCTDQVTLTSLEARRLLAHVEETGDPGLKQSLAGLPETGGFFPAVTENGLAALCLARQEPPEEVRAPNPGPCPFLSLEGRCPVYVARPLACRVMLSRTRCAPGTEAEMDPFLLTVNQVFLQAVEHADAAGWSGPLAVVLRTLARGQAPPGPPPPGLLANRPIPGLLILPEHRERIRPTLADLERILQGG